MLSKGQLEIKSFSNLYTQTSHFENNGKNKEMGFRQSFYANYVQVISGLKKNNRINIGFDVIIRSTSYGANNSSPFSVLNFKNDSSSRYGIGSAGPKIKFSPFKDIGNLSIQSTLLFPLSNNMENGIWLDWQKIIWSNQLYFDKKIGNKLNLFTEATITTRINMDKNSSPSNLFVPLGVFLSYFPFNKSTLYIMVQQASTISIDGYAYYGQAGIGGKIQLLPSFELEVSATDFLIGKNQGAGKAFNIGLRYLN
ncbi:MAG: hypothetical protein HRT72_03300 [Flavobacteriales bacterium]|nr:hypothetical protein [Flavobacteriales bacterium]